MTKLSACRAAAGGNATARPIADGQLHRRCIYAIAVALSPVGHGCPTSYDGTFVKTHLIDVQIRPARAA
ncbi:MAG: hypothetical protein JXC32_15355, partial [Anaerolineae bacterium]|nr:hypothetical protein [Anaerolineae bacterium]